MLFGTLTAVPSSVVAPEDEDVEVEVEVLEESMPVLESPFMADSLVMISRKVGRVVGSACQHALISSILTLVVLVSEELYRIGNTGPDAIADDRNSNSRWAEPGIGLFASKQLPQDDTKGVDIRQYIIDVWRFVQHLGRGPVHAPCDVIASLNLIFVHVLAKLGEAKVAHFDVPLAV